MHILLISYSLKYSRVPPSYYHIADLVCTTIYVTYLHSKYRQDFYSQAPITLLD